MTTVLFTLSRACTAVALAAAAVFAATPAQAYSELVVFGDSLSDNGNARQALADRGFPLPLPVTPYVGGRFTNGPTAAEVLASTLGIALDNYAYGGAYTGTGSKFKDITPLLNDTGMADQVSSYIKAAGGPLKADSLYMVWGGGNDFLDVLVPGVSSETLLAVGTQAIKNITGHIGALYAAGARDFFVPDLADFSFTFVAQQQPAEGQAALSSMTAKFNLGMDMALDALEGSLSGITIRRFDTNAVLKAYRADLVADGGTLTDRCWGGSYGGVVVSPGLTACSNPDKYFLFDAVHPTSGVHQALGMAFAAAVPEPSTTGLALVGLLGVAVTVGRRRAASLAGQAAPQAA